VRFGFHAKLFSPHAIYKYGGGWQFEIKPDRRKYMKQVFFILIVVLLGSFTPIQGSINSMLGGMVRHPLAATFVSFAGGMILSILSILIVSPAFPT
jgi:hypothetical protein